MILRDLHAGPARFTDLQKGLRGIAANLLSERLAKLLSDGLIVHRSAAYGVALYELTPLGQQTREVLFELARLGGQFPAPISVVEPGNLRTIAVTLATACTRALTRHSWPKPPNFTMAFIVDDQEFSLVVRDGTAEMTLVAPLAPDVGLTTTYLPLMQVSEASDTLGNFIANECQIKVTKPGTRT